MRFVPDWPVIEAPSNPIRFNDAAKVVALPNNLLGISTSEVLKQAASLAKAKDRSLIEGLQEVLQGVRYLHACLQAQKVLSRADDESP